jgi:hypothetical protein
MNLTEYLEKWGRTLFEAPLAGPARSDEPPELAEIRIAILDSLDERSYRAGGRRVFPFDLVRVLVRGVEVSRAAAFNGQFFRRYMEQEVCAALRGRDTRYPETLRVEVATTPQLPRPEEAWLKVEIGMRDTERAAPERARLIVMDGQATVAELALDKRRVNIGRTVDVYRAEGLSRRNDLAFVEDTEANRTVSREHAHITFDAASGEYRLHNDRWYPLGDPRGGQCATWIVRDGLSQAVHRDARGTKLLDGDEVHFGQAVVKFHQPR